MDGASGRGQVEGGSGRGQVEEGKWKRASGRGKVEEQVGWQVEGSKWRKEDLGPSE